MPGNTTRHFPNDRRSNRRVPVLFSAMLNRKGWRSQIVDVVDLSETGAKAQLRFLLPAGADVVLRMPGARRKLEVAATVMSCIEEGGRPVVGLRFSVADDIRLELREIVERVDRARKRPASPAAELSAPTAPKGGTRVTRRTTKSKRPARPARGAAEGGVA